MLKPKLQNKSAATESPADAVARLAGRIEEIDQELEGIKRAIRAGIQRRDGETEIAARRKRLEQERTELLAELEEPFALKTAEDWADEIAERDRLVEKAKAAAAQMEDGARRLAKTWKEWEAIWQANKALNERAAARQRREGLVPFPEVHVADEAEVNGRFLNAARQAGQALEPLGHYRRGEMQQKHGARSGYWWSGIDFKAFAPHDARR